MLDALDLTGLGREIELADGYAYVACGKDGVQIVDVSAPTSLVHALTYDTSGHVGDVAVSGATLYVADGARGLRVIDVTTPENPDVGNVVRMGGAAHAVCVTGTTAYVADDKGITILDFSTPETPAELGRVAGIGAGTALALSGSTLYVGDGDGEFYVVDVATPASASISGQVRLPGPVSDLAVDGSEVCAAVGAAGVSIVDASTPATPVLDGTIATGGEATGSALAGGALFVSDGYAGMQCVRPLVPRPTVYGKFTDVSRSRASVVSGDHAFVAAGNGGLRVYDVSTPDLPVFAGASTAATNACDVAVSGATLYVADGQYGLALFDVGTPTAPSLLGRYTSADLGSVRSVSVSGTDVVVTDGRRVERVNASTPASPVFTHAYAPAGYVYDMTWQGSHVLLAAGRSGLVALDAADLSEADRLALPGVAVDVTADGTNAYVAAVGGGWHTVDTSNPGLLALVATRMSEGDVQAVAADGGRLHVADDVSTVSALDVSVPLTPVVLGASGPLARCIHLGGVGGLLVASEDEGGAALLVAGVVDSDGDGMDDTVEQQIVDADPHDDINSIEDVLPGDDFDGDGLSNGAEVVAGTLPTDAGSVFALSSPGESETSGDFVLRWYSVAGRSYTVLRGTVLSGGFSPIATGIAATPPVNAYTTTATSVSAYYMIAVE